MHALFIPYGIQEKVDFFKGELSHQKFPLLMTSPDGKSKVWTPLQGSVRILPGGAWDYVFPKEAMNEVLTELRFMPSTNPSTLGKLTSYLSPFKLNILRKVLGAEKIPEFKVIPMQEKSLFWIMEHVSIIPLGVKYDGVVEERIGEFKGWTHEAL